MLLGPRASNLHRDDAYATGSANQLDSLVERRMLADYVAPATLHGWYGIDAPGG